jgi:hypothetical protein
LAGERRGAFVAVIILTQEMGEGTEVTEETEVTEVAVVTQVSEVDR